MNYFRRDKLYSYVSLAEVGCHCAVVKFKATFCWFMYEPMKKAAIFFCIHSIICINTLLYSMHSCVHHFKLKFSVLTWCRVIHCVQWIWIWQTMKINKFNHSYCEFRTRAERVAFSRTGEREQTSGTSCNSNSSSGGRSNFATLSSHEIFNN